MITDRCKKTLGPGLNDSFSCLLLASFGQKSLHSRHRLEIRSFWIETSLRPAWCWLFVCWLHVQPGSPGRPENWKARSQAETAFECAIKTRAVSVHSATKYLFSGRNDRIKPSDFAASQAGMRWERNDLTDLNASISLIMQSTRLFYGRPRQTSKLNASNDQDSDRKKNLIN